MTTMTAPASLSTRFLKALDYVLPNEGPYSNDPDDPGGPTCHGIILTEYEDFLGKMLTPDDVKNMSLDTARAIYLKKFWNPIHGDAYLSDAKATAIFDTAVNKGLGGCKSILNDVFKNSFQGEAWVYGSDLIARVNLDSDGTFLGAMTAEVENHIEAKIAHNPKLAKFRNGWRNRAQRLLTLAAQ